MERAVESVDAPHNLQVPTMHDRGADDSVAAGDVDGLKFARVPGAAPRRRIEQATDVDLVCAVTVMWKPEAKAPLRWVGELFERLSQRGDGIAGDNADLKKRLLPFASRDGRHMALTPDVQFRIVEQRRVVQAEGLAHADIALVGTPQFVDGEGTRKLFLELFGGG